MKARRERAALHGHLFSPTFVPPRRDDAIAALIDECSKRNPQAWETRAALFASWSAWAIKAGEPVLAAIAPSPFGVLRHKRKAMRPIFGGASLWR
jgi:hypothetical protein